MPRGQNVRTETANCSQRGYSLIELLVYTVLFSLFLLLVTQIFLTIKTISANSLAMVNLQQNYVRLFSDLNQTIRSADNIVSPVSGTSGPALSLNDGDITYQVQNGVLEKAISGLPIALSDEGINVSGLIFENLGEATQAASIKIQMNIESNYILEGNRRVSEDFQTTINLR